MIETDKDMEGKLMEKMDGKRRKWLGIGILLAVVIIALLAGAAIYNTPLNRLYRQLELGNKYLEEERYEEASIAFEQAISIDERCMEAYVGGMEAYQHMGDSERLQALYDRAREAAGELDADALIAERDYLVEIYLTTERIYGDDLGYAVECLTEGYRLTAENGQIKEQLVAMYIKWADELVESENFDKAISELTKGYDQTQDARLGQKLEEVQEKYRQYLEWQEYMGVVNDILIRIAAFCQKEDYEAVFTLMQSAEYEKLLAGVDKIEETVGLETEYGNIGLYKVDSEIFGNYMIYYGAYKGNSRQGEGVWLGYCGGNNYMAKGNWTDDLPQGEFVVREWNERLYETVVYRVISGNVDKGLWNGDVLWAFEEKDGDMDAYPVSFQNGKWVVLRHEEDGSAVVCEKGNHGGTMFVVPERENGTLGIVGFAPND